MRYAVYDITKGRFITDEPDLILKPDGHLCRNDYGDEVEVKDCIVLFYPTDSDVYFIDEAGGIHDAGVGYAPDGDFCGECSNMSCKTCRVWQDCKNFATVKGGRGK